LSKSLLVTKASIQVPALLAFSAKRIKTMSTQCMICPHIIPYNRHLTPWAVLYILHNVQAFLENQTFPTFIFFITQHTSNNVRRKGLIAFRMRTF
jgi:hypothetical protein